MGNLAKAENIITYIFCIYLLSILLKERESLVGTVLKQNVVPKDHVFIDFEHGCRFPNSLFKVQQLSSFWKARVGRVVFQLYVLTWTYTHVKVLIYFKYILCLK